MASPLPTAPTAYAALIAAASRAGRRVVDVGRPGCPAATLGWIEGAEPPTGPDSGVKRVAPAPTLLLTFAAALRCCWQDPQTHPWPGIEADEADVLAAMRSLGRIGADSLGPGAERHQRGALRKLREAGYLDQACDRVRLGPRVAAWAESQVDELRSHYHRLPSQDEA
jgi:hypothetical protein